MNKIFRQEAIEHKSLKWTGKALLISKTPAWIVSVFSAAFLIILLLFLIFGNYTRRINVYGEVITNPHPINIFSSQQGFVSKNFVKVGDVVKKGQKIYQIDFSQTTESGKVSTNTKHALESQLTQVNNIIKKLKNNKNITLEGLEEQKRQYESAHEKSKTIVDNARHGVEFAKENMKNYKTYQQRGLITKDQFNNHSYSYYQQQSIYQNLYNQYVNDSLKITHLNSEIMLKEADFDNQISQYKIQRDDLQRQLGEIVASGSLLVTSPIDGRIESLSVTVGQMVTNGDSLVQIIPNVEAVYYLVLWLPNSSLPYVSERDVISIRYDAFPFEKFGQFSGRIDNIAYVPVSSQEMARYSSSPIHKIGDKTEAYYKVLINLDNTQFNYRGKKLHLSHGMKAQSIFFLEQRPIYQWIFSPYYDIKKVLVEPDHE